MPNLFGKIQTCQYDTTVVNAAGNLVQVQTAESPRRAVDPTPIIEGGRRVWTAVEAIAGTAAQRTAGLAESAPIVGVVQEGSSGAIYGGLETVNTGTGRCGVKTSGTVVFRANIDIATPDLPAAGDIGKGVVPPAAAQTTTAPNHGCVTASGTDGVGCGTIVGFVGNYFLVDLDASRL